MKFNFVFFIFFSLISFSQNVSLSGYLEDLETGESLIGANVLVKELNIGCSTNNYGFFSLTIPKGEYTIICSYIGYNNINRKIIINKDKSEKFQLSPSSFQIDEVIISTKKEDYNIKSSDLGNVELEVKKLEKLPVLMGEKDILKTLQLLPGVQSGSEGSSGFYVRGGGPDQNLILLDEGTIYNASHLFGFFSVFNSDAINDINLIKGSMPANYGGRLSSVLDINMKDGNKKRFSGRGGVGLISSKLTLEGPIKKDTSSFIISARRTYIDILTKPYLDTTEYAGNGYFFYDLTSKFNYRFSNKDQIFISGYFGKDVFTFNSPDWGFNMKIPWGNSTGSIRWNHVFSNKLFMNSSIIFSNYKFEFSATQNVEGNNLYQSRLYSGIRDWNFKQDFNYYLNPRHTLKFGINNTYHIFSPSNFDASLDSLDISTNDIRYYAHEGAIYINDEFNLNEKILISAGIRLSTFTHFGPFERYIKDGSNNLGALSTDTTINYNSWDPIKTYYGFEPRFSTRYLINEKSSLKFGFNQNYQYIHLTSLSSSSLPTDVWIPSSSIIKPLIGRQYSIGYYRNFNNNNYEFSIEGYYKNMENLIEYKENYIPGTSIGTDNVDNNLVSGNGQSYGFELFFSKNIGNLSGWIGYTWSKTTRKFNELNKGLEFYSKYDRTHDLSIVANYQISKRLNFSTVFVYATGNTLTLPESAFLIDGDLILEWGERNSHRMEPYHRLDIALTLDGKKKRNYQSSWSFSIYNIYNRQNPYFIFFDVNDDNFGLTAKQVSLFPIIPSISWNFKF
tara:strand:- start:7669 stop:10032 length:2364 start_codon:yes stop_codon:yes gene_type:complete